MKRQVFVTCAHQDKRYRNKVMKWASTGKLGEKVTAVALDDDRYKNNDGSTNRQTLAWSLKESALVILLVGEDNYSHPWLEWEGEFCHQWGIKRVIMRIPYTNGPLPEPFTVLREIAYNPNAIEKELRPTQTNNLYY